jgi:hypothetical protein
MHDGSRRAPPAIADDYFGAIAQPLVALGAGTGSSSLLGAGSSSIVGGGKGAAPTAGKDTAPSEDSDADRAEYLKELEQIKAESEAREREKEAEENAKAAAEGSDGASEVGTSAVNDLKVQPSV